MLNAIVSRQNLLGSENLIQYIVIFHIRIKSKELRSKDLGIRFHRHRLGPKNVHLKKAVEVTLMLLFWKSDLLIRISSVSKEK